jgi:hypothetical protein
MHSQKLSAFHGSARIKESFLKETHDWLEEQSIPRDPYEIATELFGGIRTFNPEEAATVENYRAYPSRLGLPSWLASVVLTLQHHYSNEAFRSETFEESFFIPFLSACTVGVDYTPMFHQWEAFLLTKYLPETQKQNPHIKKVISLHEQSLSCAHVPREAWVEASEALERALDEEDEFKNASYKIKWNSMRAAYLSALSFVEEDDEGLTATESMADVLQHSVLLTDSEAKNFTRTHEYSMWQDIVDALLEKLSQWKGIQQ